MAAVSATKSDTVRPHGVVVGHVFNRAAAMQVLLPGDYVGLDTAGEDFVAAFTVANDLNLPVEFPQLPGLFVDDNNRRDIVFARETP